MWTLIKTIAFLATALLSANYFINESITASYDLVQIDLNSLAKFDKQVQTYFSPYAKSNQIAVIKEGVSPKKEAYFPTLIMGWIIAFIIVGYLLTVKLTENDTKTIKELKAENKELVGELNHYKELSDGVESLQNKVISLQNTANDLQSINNSLHETNKRLQNDLELSEVAKKVLQKEQKDLQIICIDLQDAHFTLKEQFDNLQNAYNDLQNVVLEKAELARDFLNLQKQNENLHTTIDTLESDKTALQTENEILLKYKNRSEINRQNAKARHSKTETTETLIEDSND